MNKETVNTLKKLIEDITAFGMHPQVEITDKMAVLKKLLVGIYAAYLNIEFEFDNKEYPSVPDFEYDSILKNVTSNFPDFGYYSSVLDANKMEPDIEIGVGDELDDLTEIIKALLDVKWRLENTSLNDALWQFNFAMQAHTEKHLVNLLKRLKERNE